MRALRTRARELVEQWTGRRILGVLPLGLDVFADLQRKRVLEPGAVRVVFDIGAHVGESANAFLRAYPGATVYCFEPVASTFRALTRALRAERRVQCHHTAMSRAPGTAQMVLERANDVFRIDAGAPAGLPVEEVRLDTIDAFCARVGIDHIDFLKIDTEGHDLDVLEGALGLIAEGRIDVIQVEAGMTPFNTRHVPFERFRGLLESHRYYLFALYEQVSEGRRLPPVLRRTNPVFLGPCVQQPGGLPPAPARERLR